MIVGIEDDSCPRLISIKLLYAENVIFVMVGCVKVGNIELSILKYHKDAVLVRELSKVTAMVFVVDTVDIWVEPYLTSTQGRVSVALE